jgi:uncharacterized protein YbjT (DUF2867 family)
MATALILGPTGLVGSHLLPLLLDAPEYSQVIAVTRRPLPLTHAKLTVVEAELAQIPGLAADLQADDTFCCLGTTIKVAKTQGAFMAVDYQAPLDAGRAQAQRGRKRYALVSALGADLRSNFFYSRVKGQVERELSDLGFARLYFARPSLLLGQRREARLGEMLGELGAIPLAPIMRGAWRKYRPIQAATVAENLLRLMRGLEPREGMEWSLALAPQGQPAA